MPEAVLNDHVARWLESAGSPTIGTNPHALPDFADVRSLNLAAIGRCANAATPIVRAWWKGPVTSIPDYWREAKSAEQHIRAKLDMAGAVVFQPMDEAALIVWCVKLGLVRIVDMLKADYGLRIPDDEDPSQTQRTRLTGSFSHWLYQQQGKASPPLVPRRPAACNRPLPSP